MFKQALRRRLELRGLSVPFIEYNFLGELRGNLSPVFST
jgi:hypothetical protein